MSNEVPKYIATHPEDGASSAYFIENDEELELYLRDGSLNEGDIVYTIYSARTVQQKDPSLCLKFHSEPKEINK